MSFSPFPRGAQLCLLNSAYYSACLATWQISDFSDSCHTLLSISCIHFIFFRFFFLTWFSFIDNILALHILSSDWFFFFLTLFSSHLFIPPSSFQSPHMSGLFQSYNTSVFWSSSDFCVLCSRGEQNFTRLVMFWIFSAATNYLLLEQKENISLDFEVAAL